LLENAGAFDAAEAIGEFEAALMFDPHEQSAIAAALQRLLADSALAERLRASGLARAREFSWERTARLTLDSYARALGRA